MNFSFKFSSPSLAIFPQILVLLLNFPLAINGCSSSNCTTNPPPIVRTQNGLIQGALLENGTYAVYKGIPYAMPPVGQLRWREPQSLIGEWTGLRNATEFGPICVQMETFYGVGKEDCLFVNVWTTAKTPAKLRPAYVWIHGGWFGIGHSSDPQFDGLALAKKGLTVVTINYRLGFFGFLAHPELNAESVVKNSSGMYGIMDQIAALKWVKANIANFGGDPSKVTIGGQSAGAGSVNQLLLSPLAKGLFRGAIAQSGIIYPRDPDVYAVPISYLNMTEAFNRTQNLMHLKGVSTISQLRAISAEQLVNGTTMFFAPPAKLDTGFSPIPNWQPVLDGYVFPQTYYETLSKGLQNGVPVLTGTTKDEFGATFFDNTTTLAEYSSWAKAHFEGMYEEYIKLYNANTDAEAGAVRNVEQRASTLISTYEWALLYKKHAKNANVYRFFWTQAPPGAGAYGAGHSTEIVYFFNNLEAMPNANWTEKDRKIADICSSYVANFVTTLDPNGQALPKWPETDANKFDVMELGNQFKVMPLAPPQNVAFFRRFFASQVPY